MYNCIIHPTDLQEDHVAYCEQSITLAHQLKADIYFLHVLHLADTWQPAQGLGFAETVPLPIHDAKVVMYALADRFNLGHDHMIIKQLSLQQSILALIDDLQADLLVLGSKQQHFYQHEIFNISQEVGIHTNCDILMLHQSRKA